MNYIAFSDEVVEKCGRYLRKFFLACPKCMTLHPKSTKDSVISRDYLYGECKKCGHFWTVHRDDVEELILPPGKMLWLDDGRPCFVCPGCRCIHIIKRTSKYKEKEIQWQRCICKKHAIKEFGEECGEIWTPNEEQKEVLLQYFRKTVGRGRGRPSMGRS